MKKGFTLIELLAVIVILALLIIITANTVLPMMNKTKKSAMVVYASKVLQKANESYMIDSMTNGGESITYSIEELMGQSDYYGVVRVSLINGEYEYHIEMNDAKERLGLKPNILTTTTITEDANKIISTGFYEEDASKYTEDLSNYEFHLGVNLINFDNIVENHYVIGKEGDSLRGRLKESTNWISTDYIRIEPNKNYKLIVNKTDDTNSAGYAWYTDKDAFPSILITGGFYPANTTFLNLTAPDKAKYLRVSFHKNDNPDYRNTVSLKKQT